MNLSDTTLNMLLFLAQHDSIMIGRAKRKDLKVKKEDDSREVQM
jgi:hypothetical protein